MSEARLDNLLRPKEFKDFIGQSDIVKNILIYGQAAMQRQETLDHILLSGPPGLGKTTLAYLIVSMIGSHLHSTSGPMMKTPTDVGILLKKLEDNDILFIDEIHGIPRKIEEYLYSAMEDFFIDLVLDRGPDARPIRFKLPRFTLIGATTREGNLTRPFRDRFGIQERLDFYDVNELGEIVTRSAKLLKVEISEESKTIIGESARGTPRVANRILKRIRDMAQINGNKKINTSVIMNGLKRLGINESGLDKTDLKILRALAEAKGPLGLKTLAFMLDEELVTIEERYEPFLLQKQLISKTARGRTITDKGLKILENE